LSYSELEEIPVIDWLDSESDPPKISTINSIPNVGVNVGQISVPTQNTMAIGDEDDSVAGLVLNKGNQIGLDEALFGEAESDTRGEFLTTSIPTTPQSKPTSSFSSHCSWGMGKGRGIRRDRGDEKFTQPQMHRSFRDHKTNSSLHSTP